MIASTVLWFLIYTGDASFRTGMAPPITLIANIAGEDSCKKARDQLMDSGEFRSDKLVCVSATVERPSIKIEQD